MQNFPETVIEIYDDEQIYNVLAITEFKPKNVVYIGTRKLKNKRIKNNIISCLRHLGLDTKCFFYSTDMLSIASIISELENIIANFGECAIDLTGGSEVALVAVGMLAKEKNIPLFRYDRYSYCYRDIYNCPLADGFTSSPSLNIPSVLALSGGSVKSHGHLDLSYLDAETEADIFSIWEIYKKHHRVWAKTVTYLQQISKNLEGNQLHVDAPNALFSGDKLSSANNEIMSELADAGLIRNFRSFNDHICFDYKSTLMRSCLCDIGICLELYVFATAKTSGQFADVDISVVIDWDGNVDAKFNTINEIDVMLVRGMVPVFISCKSGSPNVTALNEIKTLSTQFGGIYSKPVLVTMADVRSGDRYLLQRAQDMGIEVIDRTDILSGRLLKRLLILSKI